MIVSIIVTVAGLGVACMGMKCTNCGGDDKTKKSRIAMTGGIIILIGCKTPLFELVFVSRPPVSLTPDSLSDVLLCSSCSFVLHRRLLLVRSRHHPGLLQPFHPRQYQVSTPAEYDISRHVFRCACLFKIPDLSSSCPPDICMSPAVISVLMNCHVHVCFYVLCSDLLRLLFLQVRVRLRHLHRVGRSFPGCSWRRHAGGILPEGETLAKVPHLQTPQQQGIRLNGTGLGVWRLKEHFDIHASPAQRLKH